MAKLEDLREWLLDRIDGGEEMRGEDGLVSDFIRQIDAQDAELADIKQRLLPQFQGRAERAQRERQMIAHERDGMLEKLIVHQTTIANLHDVIDGMRNAPSATAAMPWDWPEDLLHENGEYFCLCVNCDRQFTGHKRRVTCKLCAAPPALQVEERRTPWIKVEDRLPGEEDSSGGRVLCYAPHNDLMYALEPEELRDQVNFAKSACIWKYWQRMPCAPDMKGEPVDHGYDRTASLNAGKYVCTCGACSHYTTREQPK